jgi:hypothetical protein
MGLYYRLAAKLLEDRFLVFLFMVCLLVVRFLAISKGPTAYPQVSTLRMDLWVPLALVLLRFGNRSPVTAAAFSLGYLADNLFGFLYFALYGAALVGSLIGEWRNGHRPSVAALLKLGAPMAAVLLFQLSTFGSLTNPAGKTYQQLHLGFLPIAPQSMFWGAAWLLLLALFPIASDSVPARRRTGLFLFGFAATQLLYFYGRSHDHNLLNLSGILLIILFLALDQLRQHGLGARVPALAAVSFFCLATLAAAQPAKDKLTLARSRIAKGVLLEPAELEKELDRAPNLFAGYGRNEKLFLFSQFDAYLNYRYRLPQVGYFAPFYASVFTEPTATAVRGLLGQGYRVLLYQTPSEDLLELNNTRSMSQAGQRFELISRGALSEVKLLGPAH